jgi:hypothetical protein
MHVSEKGPEEMDGEEVNDDKEAEVEDNEEACMWQKRGQRKWMARRSPAIGTCEDGHD